MRTSQCLACQDFPCSDVQHAGFLLPDVELDPAHISIIMIAESAPPARADYFYAGPPALFERTTLEVFHDAGLPVRSIAEILALGVYLTTAVKCVKSGLGLQSATIQRCSILLEQELALFPNLKVILLMGDVAIKALNAIAKRAGEPRVIPAVPTYKLRGQEFYYQGRRVFPSYLQVGPNFFIEKGKHKVIAQDIAAALRLIA
jgi:uracil-DNA glycosylase